VSYSIRLPSGEFILFFLLSLLSNETSKMDCLIQLDNDRRLTTQQPFQNNKTHTDKLLFTIELYLTLLVQQRKLTRASHHSQETIQPSISSLPGNHPAIHIITPRKPSSHPYHHSQETIQPSIDTPRLSAELVLLLSCDPTAKTSRPANSLSSSTQFRLQLLLLVLLLLKVSQRHSFIKMDLGFELISHQSVIISFLNCIHPYRSQILALKFLRVKYIDLTFLASCLRLIKVILIFYKKSNFFSLTVRYSIIQYGF